MTTQGPVDPWLKLDTGTSMAKPRYGFVKDISEHDAAAAGAAAGRATAAPVASGRASSGTITLVFQKRTTGSFHSI
jgi:hypothetical protein